MPAYVVSQVGELLNEKGKPIKGSKILILGMSYKRDISDVRESPSLDLLEILQEKGADVSFNDPYVTDISWKDGRIASAELSNEILSSADLVLIATDHKAYDWKKIVEKSKLIFDTRNALKDFDGANEKIYRLGGGRLTATGVVKAH